MEYNNLQLLNATYQQLEIQLDPLPDLVAFLEATDVLVSSSSFWALVLL